eukprot:334981-Alexandrium_andersonii.AAC.1
MRQSGNRQSVIRLISTDQLVPGHATDQPTAPERGTAWSSTCFFHRRAHQEAGTHRTGMQA